MKSSFKFQTVFILLSAVAAALAQNMTIQLTSPAKNDHFNACSDIRLAVDAFVQTGLVKQVDFYINGTRSRTDTKAPYEYVWKSVPDGIYEISATGIDDQGIATSTRPIFIYVGTVQPGNIIINGEFNCALLPWRLDNYVNAKSTCTLVPDLWLTDDSSGVSIDIQNQGDEVWAIQLMQPFKIKAGHTYVISFVAQAAEAKDITVDISKNYDDYAPLQSTPFTVDQLDTYGPFTFVAAADDDNLMFKFVLGGNTISI
jgi:hypothetical protein